MLEKQGVHTGIYLLYTWDSTYWTLKYKLLPIMLLYIPYVHLHKVGKRDTQEGCAHQKFVLYTCDGTQIALMHKLLRTHLHNAIIRHTTPINI